MDNLRDSEASCDRSMNCGEVLPDSVFRSACGAYRLGFVAGARRALLAEADQREMPERRHRAALDEVHAGGLIGPPRVALEGKFGAPAELARGRLKPMLERTAQTGLGPDTADQHNLAARLEHAGKLVERRLRIRHSRDDILRNHHV